MKRRFYVAKVQGYTITPHPGRAGNTHRDPGFSAHVLDRLYLHRIVASFYSDLRGGARDKAALQKARTEARRLNAWARMQG